MLVKTFIVEAMIGILNFLGKRHQVVKALPTITSSVMKTGEIASLKDV